MSRALSTSLALLLAACASSSDPAPVESTEACVTEDGDAACDRVLAAWCDVRVLCCTGGDSGACDPRCHATLPGDTTDYDTCDASSCRAYLGRLGYECGRYTGDVRCESGVTACVDALVAETSCHEVLTGAPAPHPPACASFEGSYP